MPFQADASLPRKVGMRPSTLLHGWLRFSSSCPPSTPPLRAHERRNLALSAAGCVPARPLAQSMSLSICANDTYVAAEMHFFSSAARLGFNRTRRIRDVGSLMVVVRGHLIEAKDLIRSSPWWPPPLPMDVLYKSSMSSPGCAPRPSGCPHGCTLLSSAHDRPLHIIVQEQVLRSPSHLSYKYNKTKAISP